MSDWRSRLADDSGQAVAMGALCFTILLGFAGLAAETGMMFTAQQSAQTAADSAAITGAQETLYGDVVAAAKADAAQNGYTDGQNNVTVTVNNPPLSGPNVNNANKARIVEVIVSKKEPTLFMGFLGKSSMTVSARSVAMLGTTQNCVYALNTSGTDLNLSNGASVTMNACNLYGNSSSSSDMSVTGGASLTAAGINLVGNYVVSNGGSESATVNTGTVAVSDPLAYLTPPTYNSSSCVADPNYGGGGTFKNVGASGGGTICYKSLTIANGATVTLNPGVYVIQGAFTVAGGSTVSGTGVTFYFPVGGSFSISNGINFSLIAPTSGTYNGILIYQDRANTTAESLEGGATSVLQGIVYMPKATLTFENGTNTSTYASIIAGALTFAGGATVKNYALMNSATPLSSARLVE